MTDKLLYYPYINVPNNVWSIRSMLYWDSVSAIVPPIYRDNPSRFEQEMYQMVVEGLVKQVFPFEYISQIPNFDNAFLELINSQRHNIDKKRQYFQQGGKTLLHTQKFGSDILQKLVDLGIAKRDRDSWEWYHVEITTANIFMKYLATAISIAGNFTPATDKIDKIRLPYSKKLSIVGGRSFTYEKITKTQEIRGQLLNDLMPYPHPYDLSFNKLRRFKDRNYDQLKRFRNQIEQIIIEISNIKNKEDRENYYCLKIEEITDQKEQISAKLNESNFNHIVFGTIFGLVSGTIGFASGNTPLGIFGLGNSIYHAFQGYNRRDLLTRNFAYLALIDKNIPKIEL